MSVAAAELFRTSHLRLGGAPLPCHAAPGLHITHYTLHITRDTICYLLGHYMLAAEADLASRDAEGALKHVTMVGTPQSCSYKRQKWAKIIGSKY